jgi:hypothetical protein
LAFVVKRPEVSENQISFEATETGTLKMKRHAKPFEVKWVKSVKERTSVMNQQLNVIPGF